jgi:NADH-quinone oxidoreductase subunit G
LQVVNRGHHSEIDVFPGQPLENKLAGNVVDLCPVGALGSKDFLYKQRVWYLKEHKSVCADCSTGCSIDVDTNKDIVFRLRPRHNPLAQGYFMCDEGRHGYHYINAKERLGRPLVRHEANLIPTPWAQVIPAIRSAFAEATRNNASQVYAVLSPFLTCEEAYLAAKWFKSLSPDAKLALGHVPVVGEDDRYPKDRRGNAPEPDKAKFTIHAEKCPNRKGVEAILQHFQSEIIPFQRVVEAAKHNQASAVFLTTGYPKPGTVSEFDADRIDEVPLLAVIDFVPGFLTQQARFVLPATSFAEKDGTFVNHAGLAQVIHRCVRPPQEARVEGQLFMDLLERKGLMQAAQVRKELAAEVPYFAALAGDVGEFGVKLGS